MQVWRGERWGSLLAWVRGRLGFRLQALLHRIGIHVALRSVRNSAGLRRQRVLAALGVDVILDVGANRGQYAQELREYGFRGRIISFEPQKAPFEQAARASAADPNWTLHRLAIGAEAGAAMINVANRPELSSMLELEESRPWWLEQGTSETHYVGQEEVEMAALDDLVGKLIDEGEKVGLKLDVQGFEAQVFEGASKLLSRAIYVETELCLDEAYVNQSSPGDVVPLLINSGLRLAGTEHGHIDERTGIVGWLDLAFVRSSALAG